MQRASSRATGSSSKRQAFSLKTLVSPAEMRAWSRLGLLGGTLVTLVACQLVALGAVAERIDPIGGGESCAFLPYLVGECCPEAAPPEPERPAPVRLDFWSVPEPEAGRDAAAGPSRPSSPMREAAVPVPDEAEPPCVRTYS